MSAALNDNNAKLNHLDKFIKEALKKRHKLTDAVTAEHTLIAKLKANGMSIEQISELADGKTLRQRTLFVEQHIPVS